MAAEEIQHAEKSIEVSQRKRTYCSTYRFGNLKIYGKDWHTQLYRKLLERDTQHTDGQCFGMGNQTATFNTGNYFWMEVTSRSRDQLEYEFVEVHKNGTLFCASRGVDADGLVHVMAVATIAVWKCFPELKILARPMEVEDFLTLNHHVPFTLLNEQLENEKVEFLEDKKSVRTWHGICKCDWIYHGLRYEFQDDRSLFVEGPISAVEEVDKGWKYVEHFYQAAYQKRLAMESEKQ